MYEQGFKASSTGLMYGMPSEPCVVVILGVAGDLARTTLVPSLYALGCQRLLPEPFALLGVARRAWDNDIFRDAIRTYAQEKKGFRDETWRQFAQRLSFVRGDLDAPPIKDYVRLRERLKAVQAEHHIPDNVLFHFSVPPQLYGEIAHKLAAASLLKSDSGGWRTSHYRKVLWPRCGVGTGARPSTAQGGQRRTNLPCGSLPGERDGPAHAGLPLCQSGL